MNKRKPEPTKARPKPKPTKPRERARVIPMPTPKTTALARRTAAPIVTVTAEAIAMQPFAHGNTQSIFSTAQQQIIASPARDEELDVRPDNGAVYMPHVHIRRRLSAAFGVGGWRLLPARDASGVLRKEVKPGGKKVNMIQAFELWIGNYSQPIAYAIGFGRYYPNNPTMDEGDAIEIARSNALTRCGKSIDIGGLTEWDKFEQKKFRDRMCIVVMVPKRRKNSGGQWEQKWSAQWRRGDADPFPEERPPQVGERVQFTRDAPDESEGYAGPVAKAPAAQPPQPAQQTQPTGGSKGTGKAAHYAPPSKRSEPQVFDDLKERDGFMWAKTKYAGGEAIYIVNDEATDDVIKDLIAKGTPCVIEWAPSTKKAGAFLLTNIDPLK